MNFRNLLKIPSRKTAKYARMNDSLLQMLRCPEDKSPLTVADAGLIERLNRAIDAGNLFNLAGEQIERHLQSGLIREAEDRLYPVVEHIPMLISGEAIPLGQLDDVGNG